MLRLVGATSVIALLLGAGITGTAMANGDGAIVITRTTCTLPDAERGLFTSSDVRQFTVITPSGKINHNCHGELPAGATFPDHAVVLRFDDFPILCITPGGGSTIEWQAVITPSGNVRINCNDA